MSKYYDDDDFLDDYDYIDNDDDFEYQYNPDMDYHPEDDYIYEDYNNYNRQSKNYKKSNNRTNKNSRHQRYYDEYDNYDDYDNYDEYDDYDEYEDYEERPRKNKKNTSGKKRNNNNRNLKNKNTRNPKNKKTNGKGNLKNKKKMKKKKKLVALLEIVLLIIICTVLAFFFIPGAKKKMLKALLGCHVTKSVVSSMYEEDYNKNVYVENTIPVETAQNIKGYTNIALFGIDPRNGEFDSDTHTDTIMIVSINDKTGDIKLTSVFRDTLMQMKDSDGYFLYTKANTEFFFNGPVGTINMLNKNLDLDIENYVTINFAGLATIIDSLGGLDVNITEDERFYINGYLTETREITGMDAPDVESTGLVHLSGLQATAFCRIRYVTFTDEDGTEYRDDFGRTARQRYIMKLMLKKAQSSGTKSLMNVADTLIKKNSSDGNKIVASNMKWDKVMDLMNVVVGCDLNDNLGYPFERTSSSAYTGCVVPSGVLYNTTQLHNQLFPKLSYTPTDDLKEIDEYIMYNAGGYPPES